MRKVKLFGNNIEVSCDYCSHSKIVNDHQFCTVNRVLKKGKCKKFLYNPIMREPKRQKNLQKFSADDFII
ncbi:MAG: hypothetical protein IJD68_01440 [Ruminococcus sp.]|nr:hypothetical protein [Ruminococcus sp.]